MAALLARDTYVCSEPPNIPQMPTTGVGLFHPYDVADPYLESHPWPLSARILLIR